MKTAIKLENEAIQIIRETASCFENPSILFSGGKDSIALVVLAEKAFYPAPIPFTLLHIDTGYNFSETIEFRNKFVIEKKLSLWAMSFDEAKKNSVIESDYSLSDVNRLQSKVLLFAANKYKIDALIGGGRRDEEKARAKERVFSVRARKGGWDPMNQRTEVGNLWNTNLKPKEQMRVFPISNWTELDVWRFLDRNQTTLPTIYYSHFRESVECQSGALVPYFSQMQIRTGMKKIKCEVRCRTVGDMLSTGLIRSKANSTKSVIQELLKLKTSERSGRLDDQFCDTAMENRKKEGYF